MLLKSASSHGIQAMIFLARQPEGANRTAKEIAESEGIPTPFLEKVLQQLREHGLVSAERGPKGGYRLQRPPTSISLMTIIRALEPNAGANECFLGHGTCNADQPCELHIRLRALRDQFWAVMENTTLARIASLQESESRHGRRARTTRRSLDKSGGKHRDV